MWILENHGVEVGGTKIMAPQNILKKSTVNRYLKRLGFTPKGLLLEPIVVHFQAEQSNDLWQMDFTPSELKKLPQSDSLSDKGLMLASLVDDRSGVLYQEYFLSDGETALMALQFLFNAMAPKKQKNFPFQGIPKALSVGSDACITLEGISYQLKAEMAGEKVLVLLGLFDSEIYVEFQDKKEGMVGSGKTTLLRKIQEQLTEEKQIIISRSLSTDKRRVTIGTLYTALFLDLVKEKNFQAPTQPEKRERKLLEILKKNDKPDNGKTLAVVIAGHPKLKNDLRRPTMEEVGARVQIFTLDSLIDNKDVIAVEALELLANSLITPLQINYYLIQALEKAYLTGTKPITADIIQSVLSLDIDGLEAKLARNGYTIASLSEVLNAKASEVKTFLRGQLTSGKANGFNQEINKLGVF
eukprot:gene15992-16162_t